MSLPAVQSQARRLLLDFIKRESPSSLPSTSTSTASVIPTAFSSPSNPFAPTKTLGANSSRAPKYSVRRQKVLRKSIETLGWPTDLLPVAPVTRRQLEGVKKSVEGEERKNLFRASPHIPATKVLDQLNLEKKGPYVGRKGAAFKGKLWERKMAKRTEELRVALEGADAREAQWRKVRSFLPLSLTSKDLGVARLRYNY